MNDKTNKQTDESKHKRENKKQSQKPSKKQINETFLKKTHTHTHTFTSTFLMRPNIVGTILEFQNPNIDILNKLLLLKVRGKHFIGKLLQNG